MALNLGWFQRTLSISDWIQRRIWKVHTFRLIQLNAGRAQIEKMEIYNGNKSIECNYFTQTSIVSTPQLCGKLEGRRCQIFGTHQRLTPIIPAGSIKQNVERIESSKGTCCGWIGLHRPSLNLHCNQPTRFNCDINGIVEALDSSKMESAMNLLTHGSSNRSGGSSHWAYVHRFERRKLNLFSKFVFTVDEGLL